MRNPLSQTERRGDGVNTRLAIVGIGQRLRGDDASGLEAVEAWRREEAATAGRPEVRVAVLELPGLALLDELEGVEAAIIVDSVQAGAPAGTIHCVAPGQLEAFGSSSKSAHGWGVAETLRLGGSLDPRLKETEICVIGIEGECFTVGAGLSPAVREALPSARAAIQLQVDRLLNS